MTEQIKPRDNRTKTQISESERAWKSVATARPVVEQPEVVTHPTSETVETDGEPRTYVIRRDRARTAGAFAAVAAASILGTAFVLGGIGGGRGTVGTQASFSPSPSAAIESATPRPSEAAGTPNPSEAAGTPNPSTEVKTEVNLIKIESVQAAVIKFGADAYSSNPSNWEINEWGGAHLLETEQAVKVNTAGAVVEGWIKSKMVGARDALTFVADPNVPVVELNGGTFWDFGGNEAGFSQVLAQVRAKEIIEQPDVLVVPLCAELQPINTVDVPVVKISSPKEAASMFGADAYSSNPSNWEINEWGGAHLKDNPKGEASLVNLDGTVLEGWIKAQRENGRSAITFVVHPNVNQMRVDGGTFWEFTNADKGFKQLLGQVIAKEVVEQPDVPVLPAYDCAITK